VLTALDQVSDRIRGLQAGADDYLVKPFDLHELAARVAAVARRMVAPQRLEIGALALDLDQGTVQRAGQVHDLTSMEWTVLACLARRPGRIYSRSEIEARLHEHGLADASSNSLEVIVSRLRKKLGGACISTHRGLGYRLDG
jgi:two-component system OmpR family response regulator